MPMIFCTDPDGAWGTANLYLGPPSPPLPPPFLLALLTLVPHAHAHHRAHTHTQNSWFRW